MAKKRKSKYADIQPSPDGPQFPFKITEDMSKEEVDEITQKANQIIITIDDMIHNLVRKRFRILDRDDHEEIVQRCRMWLWERPIPKFDAHRGVKVTTFLYECISRFCGQEVRRIINYNKKDSKINADKPEGYLYECVANDEFVDRKIVAIAKSVVDNPELYMTKSQARAFKKIYNSENGKLKRDIAKDMGYKRPSSLSVRLKTIYEKIGEIDIDGFDGDVDYNDE